MTKQGILINNKSYIKVLAMIYTYAIGESEYTITIDNKVFNQHPLKVQMSITKAVVKHINAKVKNINQLSYHDYLRYDHLLRYFKSFY